MNRKVSVNIALSITVIAMTVTFAITWIVSMSVFNNTVSAVTQLQAQYTKLGEIDAFVRGNYYGEISDDYLFDRVAAGYVSGLSDRYSIYYTAAEYARLEGIENGTLVDVGIEVLRDADGFRIVRVHENSPAAGAGVRSGGRILRIDGQEAGAITSLGALKDLLWGTPGSELALTCQYDLTQEEDFSIRRRENYRAPTVYAVRLTDYTYIRVASFGASAYAEFSYAVNQAAGEGTKGIVFDLRGASGAFSAELYSMIDLVCGQGTVAKSVNKTGTVRVLATSDGENALHIPMAALVNENTAAAGELFALSIRDLGGGQIVGTRTAGRGSIQNAPQRLADGSAVSVTVAILRTGLDEEFNGVGVVPGVESPAAEGFDEALLYGEPNPSTDPQLRRAFEVTQAMVRESGQDPGTVGATPAQPPDGAPVEESQAAALAGGPAESGASTAESEAPPVQAGGPSSVAGGSSAAESGASGAEGG